jgi:hypothetical protein
MKVHCESNGGVQQLPWRGEDGPGAVQGRHRAHLPHRARHLAATRKRALRWNWYLLYE